MVKLSWVRPWIDLGMELACWAILYYLTFGISKRPLTSLAPSSNPGHATFPHLRALIPLPRCTLLIRGLQYLTLGLKRNRNFWDINVTRRLISLYLSSTNDIAIIGLELSNKGLAVTFKKIKPTWR